MTSKFHLTDDGATAYCGADWRHLTGEWLIHSTYAHRELDAGEWCLDCQGERISRKAIAIAREFPPCTENSYAQNSD